MQKRNNSLLGIVVAIVGLALIIAGGSYALYERYVVGGHRLSQLAFNPVVDALGILGVVLLIVGIAMYYRMRATRTTTTSQSPPQSTGQSTANRSSSQKNTPGNNNEKSAPSKS